MSGITSGTGVFSGIDSASIIDQLMQIESRPRALIQRRVAQLQSQSAAFLDVNSRINALKAAAGKFRTASTFRLKNATSSNDSVLTATASIAAAPGSYTFRAQQLVTTQQVLSRGFADRATTAFGATSFTFESAQARLDDNIALADFNNGAGVARGKITVRDSGNRTATIDLSRAVTVEDVLEEVNTNGTAQVTASVEGGHFVIRDNAGGTITIANGAGYTTADSLGIAGTATGQITGTHVYGLGTNTPLTALNDRNGVQIKSNPTVDAANFRIDIGGTQINVNVGEVWAVASGATTPSKTAPAVATVGGVIDRINTAIADAGYSGITARINSQQGRIEIFDASGTETITITDLNSTTAADLGIATTGAVTGTVNGTRVLAGINSVLASSLNGGAGVTGDGILSFTLRDGTSFNTSVDPNSSLTDIFAAIEQASGTLTGGGRRVTVALDSKGTGFTITDNTTGAGNLVITGSVGDDTAESLGISTGAAGVAASTVSSGNLQKQYISIGTQLSTLNRGQGIGTGKMRFTDSAGRTQVVDIGTDSKSMGDIVNEINSLMTGTGGTSIRARINANGDGLEIYDTGTGSQRIKVEDVTGTVAAALKIKGTATGTGVGAANHLDGSLERTVTFAPGDTLDQAITKINDAGVGVDAAVVSTGSGVTPFRISFTSEASGRAGRFILDTNGFDLGLTTLAEGQDAVAFFGAGDVANAIAVTSGSNLIDGVLPGVKIDLKAASDDPVTVTIAQDTTSIETAVDEFITAFNEAVSRINNFTKYDPETETRGVLLGDGTVTALKSSLFATLNQPIKGFNNRYKRLADVGVKVSKEGELSIDKDKLRQALATDPAAVEALFTRRVQANDTRVDLGNNNSANNPNAGTSFTELGAMGIFEQFTERYVNSITGTLTLRMRGIDSQVTAQNSRIEAMNARLDVRRSNLQRQFAAMETTIGRLQQQSGALASIGG
jgi:flagellar hook-associated protein 2